MASTLSTNVATALQEGLENLLSLGSAFQLSQDTIPVLESFISATEVLIESAEAVGTNSKDSTMSDAILVYGKKLKVETALLQRVISNLSRGTGETVEMKEEVIASLTKIGELTANLMQVEEDNDQKQLTQAARNCASAAKTLMVKTQGTDAEMIEGARAFATASLDLVKVLNELATKCANTQPQQKDEVLVIATQIKEFSPKLIEAVKVAHFQTDSTYMAAVVDIVKNLADQIARAIAIGKMPPQRKTSGGSLTTAVPSSPRSADSPAPELSEQKALSRSELGGGLGHFRLSKRGIGLKQGVDDKKEGGKPASVTDSEQGLEVLKRARALSRAVTAQREIRRELDTTTLEQSITSHLANRGTTNTVHHQSSSSPPTQQTEKPKDSPSLASPAPATAITPAACTLTTTKSADVGPSPTLSPSSSLSTATESKEKKQRKNVSETSLMMRITKLEVENKRLREENAALKQSTSTGGEDEVAALRRRIAELEEENARLRKQLDK
jgi:hypothetical protein